MNSIVNAQVKLIIPLEEKYKCRYPKLTGEHFGYDGEEGKVISLAGNNGAWVCFRDEINKYVGCPVEWLHFQ